MTAFETQENAFLIHDYDTKPPFTGFLPGLAGVTGIPLWSFYVNRGQGICSFGIHNKGNAMMEFSPANTAYSTVQIKGFRTLMRLNGVYREPFFARDDRAERTMAIERNAVSFREKRDDCQITVTCFILPGESIGALVRHVEIRNMTDTAMHFEILDGMPQVIPYGIQNAQYKEMSNLLKSWTDIINRDRRAPIYKMRASGEDSAEVTEVTGGFYCLCVRDGQMQPVLVDPEAIFGEDLTLIQPLVFEKEGLKGVLEKEQVFANKMPCAFVPMEDDIAPGSALTYTAYMGYTVSADLINEKARAFLQDGYAVKKLAQARALADTLTDAVATRTGDARFDAYIRQCFLDNFLRGGCPFTAGGKIIHLFSRKHGDPERDYNFFSIAGEYYSQGNGNFRDVCQNRRMDCSFHPEIMDFDIVHFYSLIQMDGYNPLEIRPCTFRIPEKNREAADALVRGALGREEEKIRPVLTGAFTPGRVAEALASRNLTPLGGEAALIEGLLGLSDEEYEAAFREGFWSDHWDYTLDMVEDYLSVWPEKKHALLFENSAYRYYSSPAAVRPRRETYGLKDGHVRQYGAVTISDVKLSQPGFDREGTNWLRDREGRTVTSCLAEKMIILSANKFALLDCERLGIEMDGGKPGWNDAMNGLPGLMGSSMAETLELRRLARFLKEALEEAPEEKISLIREAADLIRAIRAAYEESPDAFTCWDRTAGAREDFREKTFLCVSGEREDIPLKDILAFTDLMERTLDDAVRRALRIGKGIMPTFFTYEAVSYEQRVSPDSTPLMTPYGLPAVKVLAFRRHDLPLFLEGPARYLASCGEKDMPRAREMARRIRESDIYDRDLGMYKTSGSLEKCGMEIGRIRIFTPGWLERESVFLHMEYKYLLGLIKAGLTEEYYEAASTALIPYLDPEKYGRSIYENSSFIASSVNPDKAVRGRGFQARLSGSNAEMLSIWQKMFVGSGGFRLDNGRLRFVFTPLLPASLFDPNGEAAFTLCSTCAVTYHNPTGKNTYGDGGAKAVRITAAIGGDEVSFDGGALPERESRLLREHGVRKIDVFFE